jgi:hypothetical protein
MPLRACGWPVATRLSSIPDFRSLIGYRGRRYLWLGAQANGKARLSRWAIGQKGIHGLEGVWRDAEDDELSGNPITQGSVDCIGGIDLLVPGGVEAAAYFWIAAGYRYDEVSDLHESPRGTGPSLHGRPALRIPAHLEPRDLCGVGPPIPRQSGASDERRCR